MARLPAEERVNVARRALKREFGIDASLERSNPGGHYVATAGPTTDSYIEDEAEAARFFEGELTAYRRNPRLTRPSVRAKAADENKIVANVVTHEEQELLEQQTRHNPMKIEKEAKEAVGSLPKAAAIAVGAVLSHISFSYLSKKVLSAQKVIIQQAARVGIPLAGAQLVKKVKTDYSGDIALGMQVDAAVALVNVVGEHVDISFLTNKFSTPLGDISGTQPGLGAPVVVPRLAARRPAATVPPAQKPRVMQLVSAQ